MHREDAVFVPDDVFSSITWVEIHGVIALASPMATMKATVQAANALLEGQTHAARRRSARPALGVHSSHIHLCLNDEAVMRVHPNRLSVGSALARGEVDATPAEANVATAEAVAQDCVASRDARLVVESQHATAVTDASAGAFQCGHVFARLVVVRLGCIEDPQEILVGHHCVRVVLRVCMLVDLTLGLLYAQLSQLQGRILTLLASPICNASQQEEGCPKVARRNATQLLPATAENAFRSSGGSSVETAARIRHAMEPKRNMTTLIAVYRKV